ncbi:universal stress protein [Thermodesulfobacteriota bacterium]
MESLTKKIVIGVDGSKNALKSFDFLKNIYGTKHELDMSLLYISPSSFKKFTKEEKIDMEIWAQVANEEKKDLDKGGSILADAKGALISRGFEESRINVLAQRKEASIAQDICTWANKTMVDAVLINKRSRTDLETFFQGEISRKLLDYCGESPVWVTGGNIDSKKILISVDSSENSMRAVDHAGFMVAGTDCTVTLFHTMRHLKEHVNQGVMEKTADLEKLWEMKKGEKIAPYMRKARDILLEAGVPEQRVTMKVIDGTKNAADDIVNEARNNDYGTIVLGRRGLSPLKEFVFGSVTSKVLYHSAGLALWIVQ